MKRKRKQALYFFLFASPGLIGFAVLSAYPILRSMFLRDTNLRNGWG